MVIQAAMTRIWVGNRLIHQVIQPQSVFLPKRQITDDILLKLSSYLMLPLSFISGLRFFDFRANEESWYYSDNRSKNGCLLIGELFEFWNCSITILKAFAIHLSFILVCFVEDGKSLNQTGITNMMIEWPCYDDFIMRYVVFQQKPLTPGRIFVMMFVDNERTDTTWSTSLINACSIRSDII